MCEALTGPIREDYLTEYMTSATHSYARGNLWLALTKPLDRFCRCLTECSKLCE